MDEELDLVVFEDDEGNEITMEVLDYFFYEGKEYALLAEVDEDGECGCDECDEEHPVDVFGQRLLRAYYEHSAEVDDLISAHLRNWTMERLPRVSLTVLRLGLAEMLYGDEKKPGVVINEAVELTKKYGADEDYQFVNGLLGTVAREQGLDAEPEQL